MTRVYLADATRTERLAFRLILLDLKMKIAGEADNWLTTSAQVPIRNIDMLVVDWVLLPSEPIAALKELHKVCPALLIVTLISHPSAHQQAALSMGMDVFIRKDELPERVAEHLKAAAKIQSG